MSEKWTPGPWHVGGEWPTVVAVYDSRAIYIAHANTGIGSEWIGANPLGTERAKANAHLIAAAPDLYEALVAARSQVVLLGGDAMEDEFGDAIQRAVLDVIDAALSRARGEQP